MDNHIVCSKETCCGCGACVKTCPKNAISFQTDNLGFKYIAISDNECVSCGKCLNVCPFIEKNRLSVVSEPAKDAYAAQIKDKEILLNSSSGGVFAGIAKYILDNGGVVYGAAWNDDFSLSHIRVDSVDELVKLQGSKYSQSDISNCFVEIRSLLKEGENVLFSGTPCQVSALKLFLGKEFSNLFTIDIICHGVGSPKMLKDEISYFEQKYKSNIESVKFRSKRKGWGTSGDLILQNGKIRNFNVTTSPYYYYYLGNSIFRNSCYECKYASDRRPGDVTIGDYWRIESTHPNLNIDFKKGVSSLLVNTDKGRQLVLKMQDLMMLFPSSLGSIKKNNGQLVNCSVMPDNRITVINNYCLNNYGYFVSFWAKNETKEVIAQRIKTLVPFWFKKFLKKHFR